MFGEAVENQVVTLLTFPEILLGVINHMIRADVSDQPQILRLGHGWLHLRRTTSQSAQRTYHNIST